MRDRGAGDDAHAADQPTAGPRRQRLRRASEAASGRLEPLALVLVALSLGRERAKILVTMKTRHVVGRSKTTVEKIRFSGEGGFHGVGTRVTFADGWTMTFIGPMAKSPVQQPA